MADSSVRVEALVKAELDRLQGLVQAETGERVSQSELLHRLLQFARRHEADFLAEGGQAWRPPTKQDLDAFRKRLKRWGEATDASRIDDELYGSDAA